MDRDVTGVDQRASMASGKYHWESWDGMTRKSMPRHWDRGKGIKTAGNRNGKFLGYQIQGCTGRHTKGSNLCRGSVQGPPPEIRPQ